VIDVDDIGAGLLCLIRLLPAMNKEIERNKNQKNNWGMLLMNRRTIHNRREIKAIT
jgi:hypothetical protein